MEDDLKNEDDCFVSKKFYLHSVISFGWWFSGGNFRFGRRRRYELPGRYPSNSTVRMSWKLCTNPTLFSGRLRLPRIAASNSRWAATCWCFSQLSTRPRCSTLIECLIIFTLMKDHYITHEEKKNIRSLTFIRILLQWSVFILLYRVAIFE